MGAAWGPAGNCGVCAAAAAVAATALSDGTGEYMLWTAGFGPACGPPGRYGGNGRAGCAVGLWYDSVTSSLQSV
ncbi:MAG: hypothetical protein B7X40_10095, partial [Cellulomonas sp. 14-74-6]